MNSTKKELIREILSFHIVTQCKEYEYKRGYSYHYEIENTEHSGDYVGDYNTKANFEELKHLPFIYKSHRAKFRVRELFTSEEKDLQTLIDGLSAIQNYGVIDDGKAYEILEKNKDTALEGLSARDKREIFIKAFQFYGKDFAEILCLEFLSTQDEIYFDKGGVYNFNELIEIILENEENFSSIVTDSITPFAQAILENSEIEYSGVDNFSLYNTNVHLCDTFPYLMPESLGFRIVKGQAQNGKELEGWIK